MTSSTINKIRVNDAETDLRIGKFKEGLQKSQPLPKFNYVPSYGTGNWDYTSGY
jgi:poly-D-alanine transfer protein DltD